MKNDRNRSRVGLLDLRETPAIVGDRAERRRGRSLEGITKPLDFSRAIRAVNGYAAPSRDQTCLSFDQTYLGFDPTSPGFDQTSAGFDQAAEPPAPGRDGNPILATGASYKDE